MGLGNGANSTYLGIIDGKITLKVDKDTPDAVQRINKDGKIVWETRHGYIEGVLKKIDISTNTYNGAEIKSWLLTLEDKGKRYILQIGYDSRYATSLLFSLCNPVVDFEQPIKISPWMKMDGDKKKTACFLSQGEGKDNNIDWFFTKEEPRGMPEWTKQKIKGKDVWDNYDAMIFLENFIEEHIKPQLTNGNSYQPQENTVSQVDLNQAPSEDDLPF